MGETASSETTGKVKCFITSTSFNDCEKIWKCIKKYNTGPNNKMAGIYVRKNEGNKTTLWNTPTQIEMEQMPL